MAVEIRKPTDFTDTSAVATNESNAFDFTAGDDLTTSASITAIADSNVDFHTSQTTINTYSTLNLYVTYASSNFANDDWALRYSINGGAGWIDILSMTTRNDAQTTITQSLNPTQSLSDLQVRFIGNQVGPLDASSLIESWDIWTAGEYIDAEVAGSQMFIISVV